MELSTGKHKPCCAALYQLQFIVQCVRFMSKINDDDNDEVKRYSEREAKIGHQQHLAITGVPL